MNSYEKINDASKCYLNIMKTMSGYFCCLELNVMIIYGISGFMRGLSCIVAGVAGVAVGLSGAIASTCVAAQVMGLSPTLNDAALGAFLVLAGASVVWTTRRKGGTQLTTGGKGARAMVHRRN